MIDAAIAKNNAPALQSALGKSMYMQAIRETLQTFERNNFGKIITLPS